MHFARALVRLYVLCCFCYCWRSCCCCCYFFILGIAILYDILIAECSQCESAKSCQQQFSIGGLTFICLFVCFLYILVTVGKWQERLEKQQQQIVKTCWVSFFGFYRCLYVCGNSGLVVGGVNGGKCCVVVSDLVQVVRLLTTF